MNKFSTPKNDKPSIIVKIEKTIKNKKNKKDPKKIKIEFNNKKY